MFSRRNSNQSAASPATQLQKLKRQDLLELLLEQMRANDELRTQLSDDERYATELEALVSRLKDKLDEKDSQIQTLRARLDQKDALIEALHEAGRAIADGEKRSDRLAALVSFEDLLVQANWGRFMQAPEAEAPEATQAEAEAEAEIEGPAAEAELDATSDTTAAAAEPDQADAATAPQHFATSDSNAGEVA